MAGENPENMAAGQRTSATTSQAKKRKVDNVVSPPASSPPPAAKKTKKDTFPDLPPLAPKRPESAQTATTVLPVKEPASHSGKRKPTDSDSTTPATPAKKAKKETTKVAKPRARRTKKTTAAEESAVRQAPQPVEVSAPVQAKIDAVKTFLATEMAQSASLLERDGNLVSIPELDLLGVVMTLHYHYQLPNTSSHASLDDVWDAATTRFAKPVVEGGEEVEYLTLDLSIPTKLEKTIQEKIEHHGLESINLLEIEMELCARRNRAQARRPLGMDDCGFEILRDEVKRTKGLWQELCEQGWYGTGEVVRKVDAGRMGGEQEKEIGKKGVCPREMEETV